MTRAYADMDAPPLHALGERVPSHWSMPSSLPPGGGANLWLHLHDHARLQAASEPLLAAHLQSCVLQHADIQAALNHVLSRKLAMPGISEAALSGLIRQCLADAPDIGHCMLLDMRAALERDPAAHDRLNVFLNQKGFQALQAHRIAHHLWGSQRQSLALFLQGRVSEVYAMDIHPAARIGSGVFIDHGTGVVIGETATVGNECTIFQDVTLGGTGKHGGDRHPKVDRGAMICAGAKILGNVRIGAHAKVGAGSVVLTDVPAGATAVGVPAAAKSDRVATLAERVQQCFTFSMNGLPPPLDSQEMAALLAYSQWLARNRPIGVEQPGRGFPTVARTGSDPNPLRGKAHYARRCASCHGAHGEGQKTASDSYSVPPLWGFDSYNKGAGMHRIDLLAGFLKANMPLGNPDLSDQEALDIAAWVRLQERWPDPRKGLLGGLLER
ncbi:MAG TPA: serine O-acetyltransferase [Albitalea sp.]|uniref:serine O-acetyltransferase n=1 Tax=Piscinibacter sp. TaxID=1903157 RepID=UPI002ED2B209